MKLSPRQLFILLWCWQRKKSLEATMLRAEVSYPTAARWFTRFRDNLPDTTPLLEGLVQADESYFSKKKSKQAKYIVTGATEPDTGRKALRITGDHDTGRDRDVLERFIVDVVKLGSLVVTDKWWAYDDLPLLGYEHESHNHSKGDYANTNSAERLWSVGKRHMRKLYGQRILTHQLSDLCKEWMARANQRELCYRAGPFVFCACSIRQLHRERFGFSAVATYVAPQVHCLFGEDSSVAEFVESIRT